MKTLLNKSQKTIVLLLLLTCNAASSFAQNNEGTTYLSNEVDINGLIFKIDPRIELLYVVGYVGGYPFMNGLDIRYREEVENYFSKYQGHEVISFWKEIGPKGFTIDGPVFLVIRQTKDLNKREKIPVGLSGSAGGERDHDKFIRLLKDFGEKSNFKSFFNSHRDFYSLILKNIEFNFGDYQEISRLENYFGYKQNSYTVIINLLGSGNFGPRVKTPSGLEIYCVMEPQSKCGNIPGFDNFRMFDDLLWHEFSHSYVNPLVDEYQEEISKYSHLYDPIKSSMRSQAYPDWHVTVKEHIVRAVTIRLAADKYGEELASLSNFRLEMGKRFIYVKPLCEKLKGYEANRDKYHSFKEFFPELILVFKNISGEDIDDLQKHVEEYRKPDVGTIPKPLDGYDHATTVIIKPTAEKDESGQQKLYDFIDKYKSNFYPESRIVTDKEAMELDLSKYDLIVFGTPEGNLVLDKYLDQIPIVIGRDKVIANRTYKGDDYQLITGWVNPLNKNRKMTIYTAQNVEKVIDINRIPHGGSNYVIGKNYKTHKIGNYKRFMKVWVCE